MKDGEEHFKLSLALRIVAEPVIPRPDAAYAFLRVEGLRTNSPIACSKFVWSPIPTRVQLISPDDLQKGLVRRGRVFLKQDAARAGSIAGFAVQKIALNGASHVPVYPDHFHILPEQTSGPSATEE